MANAVSWALFMVSVLGGGNIPSPSPAGLGRTAQENTPSIPFVGYAAPVLIGWFRCNDTLSSQSNDVRLVETSCA